MINEDRYNYFEIIGAGKLEISKSATWKCGGRTGFSFGVEWGKHGFAGGVISREEAVLLAEFILNIVDRKKIRKRKLNNINELMKKEVI